jgi:hypothetical protein
MPFERTWADRDAKQEDNHGHHDRAHEEKDQLLAAQLDLVEALIRHRLPEILARGLND